MLLKTRKRDGSWVATPVNLAVDGDRAYFGTPAGSGKPTGDALAARARRLEGEESSVARRRLLAKFPLVHRFLVPLELRLKRTTEVRYELVGFRPL